ncbi:MAG TPA: universal stress protein [Povalibacter sp.]|nr:universal stress protein [Povalibacter sp.]
MNPITNILAIVDPTTEEHPAVQKAALLATKFKARLELYMCDTQAAREARLAAGGRQSAPSDSVYLKSVLETLAEPLRKQGIDVTTEVGFGDPLADMLIAKTRATTAGLVVKDTHHHSLARRTFLTNTDWELIRGCPAPLLLTKEAPWAPSPRVVAAVDPGHANDKPALLDDRILQYAAFLAGRLGGEVHALHAYMPMAIIISAMSSEPPGALAVSAEELAHEQDAKRQQVAAIATRFGVEQGNIHVQTGGAMQLLPHAARELRADVMVMGALSRRGLKRVFIGSTAEDVLERLPCDALIIKPPDFSEALLGLAP